MKGAPDDYNTVATVALFGGVHPDNYLNEQCKRLGAALATRPWRVIVGATAGPLAQFIDAAKEVNDRRLQIELIRYENAWFCSDAQPDKVLIVNDVFDRLRLFSECDAFIMVGGELGATAELVMMWNHLQAHRLFDRRIIIIGDRAIERATSISNSLRFSTEQYREFLQVARSYREVIQIMPFERKIWKLVFLLMSTH